MKSLNPITEKKSVIENNQISFSQTSVWVVLTFVGRTSPWVPPNHLQGLLNQPRLQTTQWPHRPPPLHPPPHKISLLKNVSAILTDVEEIWPRTSVEQE